MAENINRTILNAARAVLATEHMELSYWSMEVADVVLKTSPGWQYHGSDPPLRMVGHCFFHAKITRVGPYGAYPNLSLTEKLEERNQVAWYIATLNTKKIKVQWQDGRKNGSYW